MNVDTRSLLDKLISVLEDIDFAPDAEDPLERQVAMVIGFAGGIKFLLTTQSTKES